MDRVRSRADVFAVLLAWGVLLHKVAKGDFATSVPSVAVTVGAFWLLLRPRSIAAPTILFAGIIGQILIGFDLFGNHWPYLGLLGLAWFAVRGSADRFIPIVRVSFVAMWIVVAVHKANSGFFDLPHSCAVQLYDNSRRVLVVLPDLADLDVALLPVAVFVLEAAIALGLTVRRLWPVAVGLGIAFHILSGAAVPSFAGVAFALYVPFVAEPVIEAGLAWVDQWLHPRLLGPAAVGAMALVAGANAVSNVAGRGPVTEVRTGAIAVIVTGLALGVIYAVAVRRSSPAATIERAPAGALGWAVVLVVALIGVAPYLGVRTENSLAMFSNLRTEGDTWNHAFIPSEVKRFDLQDDLVRLAATDVEALAQPATKLDLGVEQIRFVDADLARRLDDHCRQPDATAPLTVHPDLVIDDACTDPELRSPNNLLTERVLLYRVVPDLNRCQH